MKKKLLGDDEFAKPAPNFKYLNCFAWYILSIHIDTRPPVV
jgi:hypothetical protein